MRVFLWILAAGLGCSALGGGFGWLVGTISPDFMEFLVQPHSIAEPDRLGLACGLVAGLLLGAVAMGFGQLIGAFRFWAERAWKAGPCPPSDSKGPGSK
jgi:hypothetical protein